jgi:hypothetical protein
MKKIIMTLALTVFLFVGFGLMAYAEMAKEGSGSGIHYVITKSTVLPMGKGVVQINYEGWGINQSDTGKGLLHNASSHVVGGLLLVKGVYKNDSGVCSFTRPDGDQVFMTYKTSGVAGKTGKGTITYVGGTGKFVGIQGGGEFTRHHLRPPAKGFGASLNVVKSNWKIP